MRHCILSAQIQLAAICPFLEAAAIWRRLPSMRHVAQFFEQKVEDSKPSKSDINWLIMDYLVSEGYPGAAEKFAEETNILLPAAPQDIRERVLVRNAVHSGNIEEAVEIINEIDAQILDTNHALHFSLMQLQLIELIRSILSQPSAVNAQQAYAFAPAIVFAQEQLAPRVPTGKAYQDALEKTMALMLFPLEKMPADIKALLNVDLRFKVAADVNRAILEAKGGRPEAKIKQLIRARKWAETGAKEAKVDNLPAILSLGLESFPQHDDAMVT